MTAISQPAYKRFGRRVLDILDDNAQTRKALLGVARARLLPAPIWQRLHPEPSFAFVVAEQSVKYVSPPNDVIGNQLYWTGTFEEETSRIFVKLAQRAQTVLDVGANTGYFTLLACAASQQSRVIAFEPIPQIFDLLQRNVEDNLWQERCTLRREAVSNSQGITEFHVPESGSVPTSGSLSVDGFRGYQGHLIKTGVTTLDTVCATLDTVTLAKIDVEGFEDKVLEGMQETLRRCHPDIIVECNHDGPYQQVEALLSAHGYRFYALRESGPIAVERILPDTKDKHRNFLCSSDPKLLDRIR